jgi:hypothetical protein
MTFNVVTVTIAANNSPVDSAAGDYPEGNCVFSPNGILWPSTSGNVPIVPQIQTATLVNGTASVQLVASDNFATNTLNWDVIINIRGLPTVNVQALPILYASGASQSIWDILLANDWEPAIGVMGGTVPQD